MCTKQKFDKKSAQTVVNAAKKQRRHQKWRKETRAYHCPECNSWHVTKKE